MSEESYASLYRKAVAEAERTERQIQYAREIAEQRRDKVDYSDGTKPPKGYRVYRHGRSWVGETSGSFPRWWGGFWWTRPAAVNACWMDSRGETGIPGALPETRDGGGKRRHSPRRKQAKPQSMAAVMRQARMVRGLR